MILFLPKIKVAASVKSITGERLIFSAVRTFDIDPVALSFCEKLETGVCNQFPELSRAISEGEYVPLTSLNLKYSFRLLEA